MSQSPRAPLPFLARNQNYFTAWVYNKTCSICSKLPVGSLSLDSVNAVAISARMSALRFCTSPLTSRLPSKDTF